MNKEDVKIITEINKKITKIESGISDMQDLFSQRLSLKDFEVRGLETEILHLVDVIAKIYNHNKAARAAVTEYLGRSHRPKVRRIIANRNK